MLPEFLFEWFGAMLFVGIFLVPSIFLCNRLTSTSTAAVLFITWIGMTNNAIKLIWWDPDFFSLDPPDAIAEAIVITICVVFLFSLLSGFLWTSLKWLNQKAPSSVM
jgi:hypothetical protein